MVLVGAVREIEPGDAHAGAQEPRAHLHGPRGWAEGAHDLGLGAPPPNLLRPRDAPQVRHCTAGEREGWCGMKDPPRRERLMRSGEEREARRLDRKGRWRCERIYKGWCGGRRTSRRGRGLRGARVKR